MNRERHGGIGESVRRRAATSKRASSRLSEAGDTLVEVLLALIVLGLASVALLIAFSTSISASAEHRQLATSDIALSAISQQAISSINSQLNLFTTCQTLSYFQENVTLTPSAPGSIPAGYAPTLTNVQYWNPTTASFGSACTTDEPIEVTVTITHNGFTYSNSFVVDYPLAGATTQSGAGTASQLVFTTAPSSTASTSIAFAQQPVLTVEDANGNAVTTDLSPVIISIESGTGGALSGCSGSESNGVVTFSGCELSQAGTYTLMATDGNLTTALGNDPTITVSGSTTPYLVFTTEPVAAASGSALSTEPVIKVYVGGSVDTSWSGTINLSTSGGVWPSGSPCSTVTVTSGVATVSSSCTFQGGIYYDPVSNETLDIPYTMSATGTGLIPATSTTFTVTGAGTASQLVFATQPSGVSAASAATAFSTQPVVDIEDAFGNVVTSSGATVTLALNSNSFGASLSGCSSSTTKGVATFSGCELNNFGTGFTLEASSSGLPSIASAPFNITGLPHSMQFTTQPAAGASGTTLPTEPVITIYDANGYVVTASTTPITLTASGGSLTLCTNLTPYEGVVTVATCNFAGLVGTNYTFTATQGAIFVISNPISPTVAGVATQLEFTTQPVAGAAGSALTTQPIVKVEDSAGNVVLISSATISLSSSPSTGTLSSCGDLQAVAGVVNVNGCLFGGVMGTQYAMTASSANLTPDTSSNFSVTAPGPIDQVSLTGCASSIQWNANCSVTATAYDAWGNLATSYNSGVTFAQTGGSGGVSGLGTITAVNGVASDTLTGSIVGTLQIDATASSDVSNLLTVTVVGIPQTVAFYTSSSYTTTTTSATTTYAPSGTYQTYAQGSGMGTITFASGTPSVCTVNASSGLVTLVGAGTCNLTADAGATPHYADSGTTPFTLTINRAANSITITSIAPASASVGGATYTPTATATSGDAVVITSGSPSICTISAGHVSFIAAGTCTLDFNDAGNANYLAAGQVQQSFTVAAGANVITITSIAPASASVGGATYTPTATATSGDAVVITSASPSICTISGGHVSFLAAGTCTLDFNDAGNANYVAAAQVQQSFTVGKGANVITITSTAPNPGVAPSGATYTATATATSGDAVVITSATPSVCTVAGGVVSFVTFGTCTLDFNDAGNANYVAATQVTQNVTVKHTNAITITSTAPGSAVVAGPTYTPTATATSGDTVVITSGTPSVCTISAGVVSFTTAGTCTLDFNDAGNANYIAAGQVTQSFAVGMGTQAALTITSTSGTYPTSVTLTTSGGSGTGAVSYVVNAGGSASGCSVAGTTLSFTSAGTCFVTATKAADANWNATSSPQTTITIAKGTQAALTITSTSGTYPTSVTLTTSGGSGTGAVSYVVNAGGSASGCAVAGTTLSFTSAGTCFVTATKALDTGYNATSSPQTTITIAKGTQAALTITSTSGTYPTSVTLTTSGGSGTGAVSYVVNAGGSASGCAVAGTTLSFTSAGTCFVTATKALDTGYNATSSPQTTITIAKGTQAALTITSTSGTYPTSVTLTTSGGSGTGAVSYVVNAGGSASGCSVAGTTLSFTSAGTCFVTATKALDTGYNATSSPQTTITIAKGTQAALTITSTSGTYPTSVTLTTSGGSGTGAVSYVVNAGGSASGCAVAGTTLSFTSAGTCFVTATKALDTGYNATSSPQTTITIAKGTQAALTITSTSGTYPTSVTLTTSGGSGTGAVSYVVNAGGSASGCSVAGTTLSFTSAGTCIVTATKALDTGYNATSSPQTTITIARENQAALTLTSTSGTYLTALTLTYSGGSDGAVVTYAVANGTATGCAIQGGTALISTSAGTCLVTATMPANVDYNAVSSAQTTVTLAKANQATFSVTSISGSFGTALTLTTSGGSGTGAVTYAVVNGTATGCTVNGSGPYTLTTTTAGTCLVTATKATDANYNAISSAQTTVTLFAPWMGSTTNDVGSGNNYYLINGASTSSASSTGNTFTPGVGTTLTSLTMTISGASSSANQTVTVDIILGGVASPTALTCTIAGGSGLTSCTINTSVSVTATNSLNVNASGNGLHTFTWTITYTQP